MNELKTLIWQYSSNSGNWFDATKSVVFLENQGNAWRVGYSGKNGERFLFVSFSEKLEL